MTTQELRSNVFKMLVEAELSESGNLIPAVLSERLVALLSERAPSDVVQRYKRRPIYWLFYSPKGSFDALVYMHRYTPSTVSTILNEYLREFQTRLKASLERAKLSNGAKEAERLRNVLLDLHEYEHRVLYPQASQSIVVDLDDGVKTNYPKFGVARKRIPGLEASE